MDIENPSNKENLQKEPLKKILKKGSLVRVNKLAFQNSLESFASDKELPLYVFEGPGEVLLTREEYAQVRWRRPVPDVWLRIDQLEEWAE